MAKKKEYSREEIHDIVKEFEEKENYNLWQFATMDAYVAFNHTEDIENWVKKCIAIPNITQKNGKPKKDIASVRKLFIETYFAEHTEEAIKARKEEKKLKKEEEKKQKEEEEKLSDEEKLILKLKRMAKN